MMYSCPHTIKIEIDPDHIHALVVSKSNPDPGPDIKSFYLINENMGDPIFMFACETESDEESMNLVRWNYLGYIPEEWE